MAANLRLVQSAPERINVAHIDQDLIRARRGRRVFAIATVVFTVPDFYIQAKVPFSIYTVAAIAVNVAPGGVAGYLNTKIDQLKEIRRTNS